MNIPSRLLHATRTLWLPSPFWRYATAALLVMVTAVAAVTFRSYGVTWDEENVVKQGAGFVFWYASGFQDARVTEPLLDRMYGGFFSGTAVALLGAMGTLSYETLHLLIAGCGITGLGLAAWIGGRLGGPLAGFLAALFLCLTPVYYGHSFNNPKDIPFAVLCLGSFAAIVRSWPALPNIGLGNVILLGVTIGLTLAVRVIGLLVFGYLAVAWIAWLVWQRRQPGGRGPVLRPILAAGLAIIAIAWVVMVLWWPYAQLNPLLNPFRAIAELSQFSWEHPVRFAGKDVLSSDLPWSYIPVWLAYTLPEFYAIAAVAGIMALVGRQRETTPGDAARGILTGLLWVTILLPVVLVIGRKSVLYDGVRHLLFIVPPIAIAAALAVAAFFRRVRNRGARTVACLALLVSAGMAITDMIQLHPYQSLYFNHLIAGGLKGAAGEFETDYWGQSYKEGVEWLVGHMQPQEDRPLRVANCSTQFLTGYYLQKTSTPRGRFVSVTIEAHPDIVLATTRWNCHQRYAGRVLHVVERMGVPLCYVIDVRQTKAPQE